MPYRVFDHTADLGIEVTAAAPEGLYEEAAEALFDLLTDRSMVREIRTRELTVAGEHPADLLVNFLREVLYAWNGRGFLMKRCAVRQATATRIVADLRGEGFDPARHRILREIKAVTYHQGEVRPMPEGGVRARVVFDV